MAKRKLNELNLLDDYLANAVAMNEEYGIPCYRKIVSVLLGKDIGRIRIIAQKIIQGEDTDLRGIRLDVEVVEYDETDEIRNIYDYEPHLQRDLNFPRHNRYYQAKIDGRYVSSGLKDFSKIPNLYIITITNFDIFGCEQMIYTVRNRCDEVPEIEYDDGLRFIYFNTRGTMGGSEAIHNMLKYMEQSTDVNIVDDATKEVAEYVNSVKKKPEVERGFMTLQDKIDYEKENSYNEGLEQGRTEGMIDILKVMLSDGEITVESAAKRMNMTVEKFKELYL